MARLGSMTDDKKWQASCDARTLREAEEIKANAARTRAAKAHIASEMKSMAKVVAKPTARRGGK